MRNVIAGLMRVHATNQFSCQLMLMIGYKLFGFNSLWQRKVRVFVVSYEQKTSIAVFYIVLMIIWISLTYEKHLKPDVDIYDQIDNNIDNFYENETRKSVPTKIILVFMPWYMLGLYIPPMH